ncbi:MAG: hypothetical protein R2880_16400 [Deinococcales bacterium]
MKPWIYLILALAVLAACSKKASSSYVISAFNDSAISGTAVLQQVTHTKSQLILSLNGLEDGKNYQAAIYRGSPGETLPENVFVELGLIEEGALSRYLNKTAQNLPLSYQDLSSLQGYIAIIKVSTETIDGTSTTVKKLVASGMF